MCLKIYRLKTTQTNIETNSLLENVLEVRDYIRNNNVERGGERSVGRGRGLMIIGLFVNFVTR